MKLRLALLVIAVLVSSACSDRNSKAREEFLSGCMRTGGTKAACSCAFDRLEKTYKPESLDLFHESMASISADAAKSATLQAILNDTVQYATACAKR